MDVLGCSIGARGETRTLTLIRRRILNPLRLPFRHPGLIHNEVHDELRIMHRSFAFCNSLKRNRDEIFFLCLGGEAFALRYACCNKFD